MSESTKCETPKCKRSKEEGRPYCWEHVCRTWDCYFRKDPNVEFCRHCGEMRNQQSMERHGKYVWDPSPYWNGRPSK